MGKYKSAIESENAKYWTEYNQFELSLKTQQDTNDQMKAEIKAIEKKLLRLNETTFINEVFKIGAVDEIATIGGLRLGRTQRIDVSWDEINAAMG